MLAVLEDGSESVRRSAATAFKKIKTPKSFPALTNFWSISVFIYIVEISKDIASIRAVKPELAGGNCLNTGIGVS